MDKIWANRLIAGTKSWSEMPVSRRIGVKKELSNRVIDCEITSIDYERITGEIYAV